MSLSAKDSAEVMEFMTLFARLKQWCDERLQRDLAAIRRVIRTLAFALTHRRTSQILFRATPPDRQEG